MDTLQIIGSIVCFLGVLFIPTLFIIQTWNDGKDLSSDQKEKKHA